MTHTLEKNPSITDSSTQDEGLTDEELDTLYETHHINAIQERRVGLGAAAVYDVINHGFNRSLGISDTDEEFADSKEYNLKEARNALEQMAAPRDSKILSRLDAHLARQYFNKFIADHSASPAVDELLGLDHDVKKKNYLKRLIQKDAKDEYVVSDDALLNFLEWHNFELKKSQAEYDGQHEEQKKLFLEKLDAAIKAGWIPEWVNDWAGNRVADTVVVVDDGFETEYRSIAGNAERYPDGPDEVVISPLKTRRPERLMTHEFVHVIDGYKTPIRSARYSGLYQLFAQESPLAAKVALNEAVVEHLSDSMFSGKSIDVIDPRSRERRTANGIYAKERYLLNTLANMGKKKIDIRTFVAAHFDDGKHRDQDGLTPLEKLRQDIDEAFPGQDVLDTLAKCKTTQDVHKYAKKLRKANYGRFKMTKAELKQTLVGVAGGAAASTALIGLSGAALEAIDSPADAEHSYVVPYNIPSAGEAIDVSGGYNDTPSNRMEGPGIYESGQNHHTVTVNVSPGAAHNGSTPNTYDGQK